MNLKPCPFCNKKAEGFFRETYDHTLPITHFVACTDAHCVCNSGFITKERAIEAWNNRPGEREVAKRIVRKLANEAAEHHRLWIVYDDSSRHLKAHVTAVHYAKLAAKEGGLLK